MVYIDTLKIIGVVCLLLAIVGTIGNFLIFLVCFIRLRTQVTFIFIMFLAITDTVTLYGWNIAHFSSAFYDTNLQQSIWTCRVMNFFQFASFHSSAWLLVSLFTKYLV